MEPKVASGADSVIVNSESLTFFSPDIVSAVGAVVTLPSSSVSPATSLYPSIGAKKLDCSWALSGSTAQFQASMKESEVISSPSVKFQSFRSFTSKDVELSFGVIDSATPMRTSPSGVYRARPVKRFSITWPPLVSLVFVGTSGFCGSLPKKLM